MCKPFFLITIDTEGDNLWQNQQIETQNARHLQRFQSLCERFNFKPTYLTNYEMAKDVVFQKFGRKVIQNNSAEIGTHVHAWNSPPLAALTDNDAKHKPYLIEYSDEIMFAKLQAQHELLENTFEIKIKSHRAGRWALDSRYIKMLAKLGYQVDCSVTPFVDWSKTLGAQNGKGGSDYRLFPKQAYFMDLEQINIPGNSNLLQIPMSTRPKHSNLVNQIKASADKLLGKTVRQPSIGWLRSSRNNLAQMQRTALTCLSEANNDYLEYMLHSSELMPNGSPTFRSKEQIESLYKELEQFFIWISLRCQGATLSEYYQFKITQNKNKL